MFSLLSKIIIIHWFSCSLLCPDLVRLALLLLIEHVEEAPELGHGEGQELRHLTGDLSGHLPVHQIELGDLLR